MTILEFVNHMLLHKAAESRALYVQKMVDGYALRARFFGNIVTIAKIGFDELKPKLEGK